MKRILSLVLCSAMMLMSGCSNTGNAENTQGNTDTAQENYVIGIAQFAPHASLDNCVTGFKLGLEEAGITNVEFDFQNAQSDMAAANQIAQSMVAKKCDLICAVATPMAQAAYNASNSTVPVIYTAVTDPVAAQLAKEDGTSLGKATGTSDKLAINAQLEMIRSFMPEAKTIGIMYSTSETNSVSAIAEYKELAPSFGFEIVESGISQSADIPMAAADLAAKVDCISNLTDNTVVTNLSILLEEANKAGIPVFGSEIEQVKNGCVATEGIDYVALGKQTGVMAARVLKGEDIQTIPYETITDYGLYINEQVLAGLGIQVPEELTDKAVNVE